jgi:hypothetical protein
MAAECVHDDARLYKAHRGAFLYSPGIVVVFGNDGWPEPDDQDPELYDDPWGIEWTPAHSRREVEALRRELPASGWHVQELALGTHPPTSWAMLVLVPQADDQRIVPRFCDLVWKAWRECVSLDVDPHRVEAYARIQREISDSACE